MILWARKMFSLRRPLLFIFGLARCLKIILFFFIFHAWTSLKIKWESGSNFHRFPKTQQRFLLRVPLRFENPTSNSQPLFARLTRNTPENKCLIEIERSEPMLCQPRLYFKCVESRYFSQHVCTVPPLKVCLFEWTREDAKCWKIIDNCRHSNTLAAEFPQLYFHFYVLFGRR